MKRTASAYGAIVHARLLWLCRTDVPGPCYRREKISAAAPHSSLMPLRSAVMAACRRRSPPLPALASQNLLSHAAPGNRTTLTRLRCRTPSREQSRTHSGERLSQTCRPSRSSRSTAVASSASRQWAQRCRPERRAGGTSSRCALRGWNDLNVSGWLTQKRLLRAANRTQ
jgi:hypothetical protein